MYKKLTNLLKVSLLRFWSKKSVMWRWLITRSSAEDSITNNMFLYLAITFPPMPCLPISSPLITSHLLSCRNSPFHHLPFISTLPIPSCPLPSLINSSYSIPFLTFHSFPSRTFLYLPFKFHHFHPTSNLLIPLFPVKPLLTHPIPYHPFQFHLCQIFFLIHIPGYSNSLIPYPGVNNIKKNWKIGHQLS